MSPRTLRALLAGLALCVGLSPVRGEAAMPGSPREQEAFALLEAGDGAKAREIAQELLREAPESYVGHHILGRVFHEHEHNLPRAEYHLRRSYEAFESSCPDPEACGAEAWRWRARTLIALVHLAGDMDRRELQLHWLDLYEARYSPRRWGNRAWAKMKLGDFAAARRIATEGIAEAEGAQLDGAWTALCAVEAEEQRHYRAWDVCSQAAERVRGRSWDGTVEFRNAAHAALTIFRFDEAERLYDEATRRPVASYSNPWRDLTSLYVQQGRFPEAVQSLLEARRYVQAREVAYVYVDRARQDSAAAELLLVAGRSEEALHLMQTVALHPDRMAGTSVRTGQQAAGTLLLLYATIRAHMEALRERAALMPFYERPPVYVELLRLKLDEWRTTRRLLALFADPELLLASMRPLDPRGVNLSYWALGDIAELLGPGLILESIARARVAESRPEASAYLDALRGEALVLTGGAEETLALTAEVLEQLPRAEVLLRARVHLQRARAALRLGDRQLAARHLARTLRDGPTFLKIAGISLPTRSITDQSPFAEELSELLLSSPRLEEVEAGPSFTLKVTQSELCLLGPDDSPLSCLAAQEPSPADSTGDASEDTLRRLARRFLQQAFSPTVNLSQADLRSLEGATTGGGKAATHLETLFEQLTID